MSQETNHHVLTMEKQLKERRTRELLTELHLFDKSPKRTANQVQEKQTLNALKRCGVKRV